MEIPDIGDLFGNVMSATGLAPPQGSEQLQAALEQARKDYAAYRPEAWAARQGALQHTLDLFQPMNARMVELYGADAALPLDAAFQYDYRTPPPGGAGGAGGAGASPGWTSDEAAGYNTLTNDPLLGGLTPEQYSAILEDQKHLSRGERVQKAAERKGIDIGDGAQLTPPAAQVDGSAPSGAPSGSTTRPRNRKKARKY